MCPFHRRTLGLLAAGVLMLSSAASGGDSYGCSHGPCGQPCRPLPVYCLYQPRCQCQHGVEECNPLDLLFGGPCTCSWNRLGCGHGGCGHDGCGCGYGHADADVPAVMPPMRYDNGSPSDKRPTRVAPPPPPESSGLGFKAREKSRLRRPVHRYPVLRRGRKSQDSALPPYMAPESSSLRGL